MNTQAQRLGHPSIGSPSKEKRTRDARTSSGDPLNDGGCGGIRARDTAKIEFEIHRMGREGWGTGVLQAAHVLDTELPLDRHTEDVAMMAAADSCHR